MSPARSGAKRDFRAEEAPLQDPLIQASICFVFAVFECSKCNLFKKGKPKYLKSRQHGLPLYGNSDVKEIPAQGTEWPSPRAMQISVKKTPCWTKCVGCIRTQISLRGIMASVTVSKLRQVSWETSQPNYWQLPFKVS